MLQIIIIINIIIQVLYKLPYFFTLWVFLFYSFAFIFFEIGLWALNLALK
jgi:hypothetical protein